MDEKFKKNNNSNDGVPVSTEWDILREAEEPAHTVMDFRPYGLELTDVNEINIDTQEGRFDWLTSLVENAEAINSERLNALRERGLSKVSEEEAYLSGKNEDELIEGTQRDLELVEAQKAILEGLDFSNSSVIQALRAKSEEYQKKYTADGMSEGAAAKFRLLHGAADDLYDAMTGEVRKRRQEQEPREVSPVTSRELVQEISDLYDNYAIQEEAKMEDVNSSGGDKMVAERQKERYQNRQQIILSAENMLDGENSLEDVLDAQIKSKQGALDRQRDKETEFAIRLRVEIEDLMDVRDEVAAVRQHYIDKTTN
jgi:hypothetical protein